MSTRGRSALLVVLVVGVIVLGSARSYAASIIAEPASVTNILEGYRLRSDIEVPTTGIDDPAPPAPDAWLMTTDVAQFTRSSSEATSAIAIQMTYNTDDLQNAIKQFKYPERTESWANGRVMIYPLCRTVTGGGVPVAAGWALCGVAVTDTTPGVTGHYAGSFDTFRSENPGDLINYAGSWGVDTGAHTAWAIISTAGWTDGYMYEFSVSPEPATLALLGAGGVAALLLRRRRARK